MKVRVGVVGVGMIAHIFHLDHYKKHPNVELVAVADKDLNRANKTDQFVKSVMTRSKPSADAAQGYEIVKMLEAIRISSETNAPVKIPG